MHSTWFISSKLFAFVAVTVAVVGRLVNGSGLGRLPVWVALTERWNCMLQKIQRQQRQRQRHAATTGDTFAFYAFLVKQLTLIEYAIYAAICKRKWLFAKNYYCPSWLAGPARPHPQGMLKPPSRKPFRASILTALSKYYEYEYCKCRLRLTRNAHKKWEKNKQFLLFSLLFFTAFKFKSLLPPANRTSSSEPMEILK